MTNTYFNYTSQLARFTTADAVRLNSTFVAIQSAFDKLPSVTELNQGSRNYAVATNIGNAYSVTVPFTLTSYSSGLQLTFLAAQPNSSSATLNANAVGPVTIKRFDGTNLLAGDIRATSLNTVVFDGTSFRLQSMHGGTESLAASSAASAAASSASASTSASDALSSKNAAAASASSSATSAATSASMLASSRFGIRNLILNPLFWMSQRIGLVFSGTHGAGVFIRDRWKTGTSGATWAIANQIMTITAGSVVQVVLGRNIHFGGTYTLSWTGTSAARVNGVAIANGGQVTLPSYTNVTIEFLVGTFTIPQFEFSSIRTSFEMRPTDLDRLMCLEYYQKSYSEFVVPGTATYDGARHGTMITAINFDNNTITLNPSMRGNPVIWIYNPEGYFGTFRDLDNNFNYPYVVTQLNDRSFNVFGTGGIYNFISGHRFMYHWIADAEV